MNSKILKLCLPALMAAATLTQVNCNKAFQLLSSGEEVNSIGMELVWIPPGEFDMGTEIARNAQPITRVRISKGFYLGKHEVTQGEWDAVMERNPSEFDACGSDCPVESVSWSLAKEFIKRLNVLEKTSKYRLPTEAEWEYAARAGTRGDVYDSDVDAIAWHKGNSGGTPHPVGQKRANAFGLHDMLGNVREWVHDFYWYMERLPGGAVTDPTGASAGMYRVIRGGCYYDSTASLCGASFRHRHYPRDDRGGSLGFRLARDE